jgi:hypothetical protein
MIKSEMILGIVLFLAVMFSACAQQYDPKSDFRVETLEGGKSVKIAHYIGNKSVVRIPPRIQQLPVTHIGDEAFMGLKLTSVTTPNSVTVIWSYVFGINQLTSVTIGADVQLADGFSSFDNGFDSVYDTGGRCAGTYTITNSASFSWVRK